LQLKENSTKKVFGHIFSMKKQIGQQDVDLLGVCSKGSVEDLKRSLDKGIDPNKLYRGEKNLLSIGLLHETAEDPIKTEMLLKYGADPNIKSEQACQTPLHIATYHSCIEVCRLLLEHGADPEMQDIHGYTPLDIAIAAGENSYNQRGSEKVLELLLKTGVDPNKPSSGKAYKGQLPLSRAAAISQATGLCRLLLLYGANPTLKEDNRLSPLHWAKKDNFELINDAIKKWNSNKITKRLECLEAPDIGI